LFTSLHVCSAYLDNLLETSCPEPCPLIPWDNITNMETNSNLEIDEVGIYPPETNGEKHGRM